MLRGGGQYNDDWTEEDDEDNTGEDMAEKENECSLWFTCRHFSRELAPEQNVT